METTKSTFEDLEIWQLGRDFRKKISGLVKNFPSEEKYRLADQMIRASRSVTANISEGYGRYHYQENIQLCRQSRGSLFEMLDHLTVALDENYISKEKYEDLKGEIFLIIRKLNGYIQYLSKKSYNLTTKRLNHLTVFDAEYAEYVNIKTKQSIQMKNITIESIYKKVVDLQRDVAQIRRIF